MIFRLYVTIIDYVVEFIDGRDIFELSKCRKNDILKKYLYYSLLNGGYNISNNSLLVENYFSFVPEEEFLPLYKYLSVNSNISICGGYMTAMLFEREILSSSDMDIYIFGKSKEKIMTEFQNLIEFCGNPEQYYIGPNVREITMHHRKIQIILAECYSLTDILLSFDCSHVRNAYYMGKTYTTFDAIRSKENNTTFFTKNIKTRRALKVLKYGLQIINPIDENKITNYTPTEKIPEKVNENHKFYPSKKWLNGYSENNQNNFCDSILCFDIFDEDHTYKLEITKVKILYKYNKHKIFTNNYVIKYNIKVNKIQNSYKWQLVVTDKEEVEKLKRIKIKLFKIFNDIQTMPTYIKYSDTFKFMYETDDEVFLKENKKTKRKGYSTLYYNDNINLCNNIAYINILENTNMYDNINIENNNIEIKLKLSVPGIRYYHENDKNILTSGQYGKTTHYI